MFTSLIVGTLVSTVSGCGAGRARVASPPEALVVEPIELATFGKGRKVKKKGMTVVYLSGPPREIGLAHGRLLRDEIIEANRRFLDGFDAMDAGKKERLLKALRWLEERIPAAYVEEMKGIAEGADLPYDKVLYLNSLTTLSMSEYCFSFATRDPKGNLLVFRHIDTSSDMYEDMVLFVIRPDTGNDFAALLNPGWVDGETGINQAGLTVAQHNIRIRQTEWDVTPVTILTRQLLQHASTVNEAYAMLEERRVWPTRLLFLSQPEGATVVEMANTDLARIDMAGESLAVTNHPRRIPADDISSNSTRRLRHADEFLRHNQGEMGLEKGVELLRTAIICSYYRNAFVNKQSVVFRPATRDFWIAQKPEGALAPAASGAYAGFNLLTELGVEERIPSPTWIPAE